MALRITIPEAPSEDDRAAVLAPLVAYNQNRAGNPQVEPLAIMLTDADGNHVGGLWGRSLYQWLFVELLAVPEAWRGQDYGTALIREAERIARERGCVGMWLDTFEFQARGFYEKLGFELFGTLDDHPGGQSCFFMRKRL